jgi:hypothetical protein
MDTGVYDYDKGFGYMDANIFSYKKMPAREDLIGPHGEKATRDRRTLGDILQDSFYMDDNYDYEYGQAKDKATQSKQIQKPLYVKVSALSDQYYGTQVTSRFCVVLLETDIRTYFTRLKDRFESIEDDLNPHLGGSWFRGMAEEVQHQNKGDKRLKSFAK